MIAYRDLLDAFVRIYSRDAILPRVLTLPSAHNQTIALPLEEGVFLWDKREPFANKVVALVLEYLEFLKTVPTGLDYFKHYTQTVEPVSLAWTPEINTFASLELYRAVNSALTLSVTPLSLDERTELLSRLSRQEYAARFQDVHGELMTSVGNQPLSLDYMKIPRCRLSCERHVDNEDILHETPWMIAVYSTLMHVICQQFGFVPGHYKHSAVEFHMDASLLPFSELYRQNAHLDLTPLTLNPAVPSLFAYQASDFTFAF